MLMLDDTVMGQVQARYISRNRQYSGWLARLWARSSPVTYHEAGNIVVGLSRLRVRSGPVLFLGASNTVLDWHGYGRVEASNISRSQQY